MSPAQEPCIKTTVEQLGVARCPNQASAGSSAGFGCFRAPRATLSLSPSLEPLAPRSWACHVRTRQLVLMLLAFFWLAFVGTFAYYHCCSCSSRCCCYRCCCSRCGCYVGGRQAQPSAAHVVPRRKRRRGLRYKVLTEINKTIKL